MPTVYQDLGVTTQSIDLRDGLIAGTFPRTEKSVTIASGSGVLVRGTLLGRITASGKHKAYSDSSSDGSQTAVGVLAADVDATAGDAPGYMYITGEFNEAKLVGLDAAARTDLEPLNIYAKTVS